MSNNHLRGGGGAFTPYLDGKDRNGNTPHLNYRTYILPLTRSYLSTYNPYSYPMHSGSFPILGIMPAYIVDLRLRHAGSDSCQYIYYWLSIITMFPASAFTCITGRSGVVLDLKYAHAR